MRKNLPWFLLGVPLLAMIIANLLAWPHLADRIPIHWNLKGEVDAWGGRSTVWILPGIYLWIGGLLQLLTLRPPGSKEPSNQLAFNWIQAGMATLFLYLYAYTLLTALNPLSPQPVSFVKWGIACFVIFSGLAFNHSKRNEVIGIRTKWTLASDEIWEKTHRFAGGLFITTGTLMAFFTWLFNIMVWLCILFALCCLAVFYSYRLHKAAQNSSNP